MIKQPPISNQETFNQRLARAADHWQQSGYSSQYISQCLRWVVRFYRYCTHRKVVPADELTRKCTARFVRSYARKHGIKEDIVSRNASAALSLWRKMLIEFGCQLPEWRCSPNPPEVDAILAEYRVWCRRNQSIKDATLAVRCQFLGRFLLVLRRRVHDLNRARPTIDDIDKFVEESKRKTPASISGACTALRSYLRFQYETGRTATDLSLLVGSVRPNIVRPPRAVPWKDVRSILRAVDRRRPLGKRDYAMLLLMASYGLGRAEVAGLSLDDIDWHQRTLRIIRKKNELEILLPLSDAVANALALYLRNARPPSGARRVFLRMTAPYTPLTTGAISPIVSMYAAKVGVMASPHTLRHSHACRHVELNSPPKAISDILGHTDPESISTYVRVAHNRLRQLCLPLP
jgi:integrase